MDDYSWIFKDNRLETTENIEKTLLHTRRPHRKNLTVLKQEAVSDFLTALPKKGESLHIVSNGKYDFWTFVPVVIGLLKKPVTEFYGSTWTMNRGNVLELLALFDEGKIEKIGILTGTYFKRRETAVYATLLEGLLTRKQRYVAFQNHAKVLCFRTQTTFITIEGSANFTANPRLEQYVMSNDRSLYLFHSKWMKHMLGRGDK